MSRAFRVSPSKRVGGVGCIPENRPSRQPGHHFLEQLQTFCAELRIEDRSSGNIAAWVSRAGDEPGSHGINSGRVDDRDGRGRVLGGQGRGRCDDYDDVNLQSNHLGCKLLESLHVALCIPALNDEVLPLLVPELPEALEQRVIKYFMSVRDEPDPPNPARRLRTPGERPRNCRAAEKQNELPTSHIGLHCGWQSPASRACHNSGPRVPAAELNCSESSWLLPTRFGWRALD